MKQMKTFLRLLIGVALIIGAGAFVITNWSWVFSKRVHGKIINVKRVTDPTAILGSKITAEQLHSYSVLIQGDDGKLYTASSEDRQWEVASAGYCVDALLYRYPPWNLQNAGTFFNARLVELHVCDGQSAPPSGAPNPPPSSNPPAPTETGPSAPQPGAPVK